MHDEIACISLRSIDLVRTTRLVFLAMGEVLCDGLNLALSSSNDSRGSEARIVLLPLRINDGVLPILIGSIPLHHVNFLKALLHSC